MKILAGLHRRWEPGDYVFLLGCSKHAYERGGSGHSLLGCEPISPEAYSPQTASRFVIAKAVGQ
jgi:hypothetical protein